MLLSVPSAMIPDSIVTAGSHSPWEAVLGAGGFDQGGLLYIRHVGVIDSLKAYGTLQSPF